MVNKVILVGNLGRDPELKHLPSGQAICQFSIATSESYTDRAGQKQEKTEWHRIVVWEKLAEVCARFLGKGSKVYVEGKLQTREYEKDGQKHYQTEIVAMLFTLPMPTCAKRHATRPADSRRTAEDCITPMLPCGHATPRALVRPVERFRPWPKRPPYRLRLLPSA